MAERTGISWTDHTFNSWVGCTKVSPACDFCYAESWAKRTGAPELWNGERRRTTLANWKQPRKWNRDAADAGVRRRVFCCSLADVFDNKVPTIWREDLWELIRETPSLDWQMLTKRPQNIAKMLPPDWGHGFHNVWLGTTVENQKEADRRIQDLLAVPAEVRFLSCEPLLGPVDLTNLDPDENFRRFGAHGWSAIWRDNHVGRAWIDWIIVGGESGPGARPMRREWAESLIQQCRAAGVPVWFKQVGSSRGEDWPTCITGKGDDAEQWPAEFRFQEMPA